MSSPRSELFFDFADGLGEANFIMWHHMRHRSYDLIASQNGNSLPPLDLSTKVDSDWLHRHAVRHATHRKIAGTVTRNGLAGLKIVRWHDRVSQQDWLYYHAIDHMNLDEFYGLG